MPLILYPEAIWLPLVQHSDPGTLAQRNLIVLHITDGPSAMSAIWTFRNSVHPFRVSAHFVIDRDGKVYQTLDVSDTAWHVNAPINPRSVGIEHAALTASGAASLNQIHAGDISLGKMQPFVEMLATDAQHQASAKLVKWLSGLMKIPVDRHHVVEHCEADPHTTHSLCCHGALDIDRVVRMASAISV